MRGWERMCIPSPMRRHARFVLCCIVVMLLPTAARAQTSASASAEVTVRVVGRCPSRGRDCHQRPEHPPHPLHPPHPQLVTGGQQTDGSAEDGASADAIDSAGADRGSLFPLHLFLESTTTRAGDAASLADRWLASTSPSWDDESLVVPLTITLTFHPSLALSPQLIPATSLWTFGMLDPAAISPANCAAIITITAEY